MLETGDFTRIRLQDEPRYKKPIGIYWLQALSVTTLSDVHKREIWAWRVPSLLGAVIATLATFWGGIVLVGRRAAFVSAALLATSVLLSTEGMIAKTDAMVCGLTALAMAALARIFLRAGGGRTAIVFWAALACGVLMKGPITPMVVGLAVIAVIAWKRDVQWLRPLANVIGVAVAALIIAPWLIALDRVTEGAFLIESLVGDVAPKLAGGGEHANLPPGVHLLLLPVLIFPACIGLGPALTSAWAAVRAPHTDPTHDGVRFLVAWAAPTWLVFEIATTKLAHYTLPVYPAIALLAGAGLLRWLDVGGGRRKAGVLLGFGLGGIGVVAVFAYAAYWGAAPHQDVFTRMALTGAVGGAVVFAAFNVIALTRQPPVVLAATLIAALALLVIGREIVAPRASNVLVSRAAARALDQSGVKDGTTPVLVVGYREPSLVFVEGTATLLRQGATAGAAAIGGQGALVEARERDAFEASLHAHGFSFTPVGAPVTGQNYSNGDEVSLQPGRVIAWRSAPPETEQ